MGAWHKGHIYDVELSSLFDTRLGSEARLLLAAKDAISRNQTCVTRFLVFETAFGGVFETNS